MRRKRDQTYEMILTKNICNGMRLFMWRFDEMKRNLREATERLKGDYADEQR